MENAIILFSLLRFYIFKIIEQKMAMNRKSSCTEASQSSVKNANDNSQDWVCIKCNNLNFSFRKKCNRCKVQSREDNHQIIYLDYYYYNHYYHYQAPAYEKKNSSQDTPTHRITPEQPTTPVKKNFSSESNIADKENKGLPSVSPLVKKYKDSESKKRREVFKGLWKGEPIQKLFGQEIWNAEQFQEIDLKVVQKQLSATDDEQSRQEFIRSVQKMII